MGLESLQLTDAIEYSYSLDIWEGAKEEAQMPMYDTVVEMEKVDPRTRTRFFGA
jgi:hypothetical protein